MPQLSGLPVSLFELQGLRVLDLSGNNFKSCPAILMRLPLLTDFIGSEVVSVPHPR